MAEAQKINGVERITVEEFRARIKAQGAAEIQDVVCICPICKTKQTMRQLIAAGAGADVDAVEKYFGFSCIGRFTGAGPHKKGRDGVGCNWSLGGLFKLHQLEVETPDGEIHPRFHIASPDEVAA